MTVRDKYAVRLAQEQHQGYKNGKTGEGVRNAVSALEKEYNRLWQDASGDAGLHFSWRAEPADAGLGPPD